jgi:signal transduction histidine kinase
VTKDQGRGSERLVEGLNRIEQNAARMTSMINELLDLSRLQMGEGLELNRQPTDLVSLVPQCVTAYDDATETHPIAVESQVPQLIGTWDADRLERVIANLLSNAVKYSPQNTPIVVTIQEEDQEGAAWASVSVEDHGIGIPTDDLPYIFERFRRAHNVSRDTLGTGIGLSGARQIVEQHGGTIEVDSEEGVGSTFTVRLPLEAQDGGRPDGQRQEDHHAR